MGSSAITQIQASIILLLKLVETLFKHYKWQKPSNTTNGGSFTYIERIVLLDFIHHLVSQKLEE
jgi:hypothetical protein